MKLSTILSLVLFTTILSCGGPDSSDKNEDNSAASDTLGLADTVLVDTALLDGDIYTAHAAIDGPGDELWIFQDGEMEGDPITPMPESYEILHVIPHYSKGSEISEDMSVMNTNNFELYGDFGDHTGPVIFFYNEDKSKIAIQYNTIKGKPDGIVSLYHPDGAIFMQRRYDGGLWTESIVSPHSCNWKFVQNESKLWIHDPGASLSTNDRGEPLYRLMPTIMQREPGDNTIEKIVEKASFDNPFQINDKNFTGTLEGLQHPSGVMHDNKYFELNFENGWLHGDIKIFSWWGELELHEVFVEGELDTTIYVMDYSQMDGMAKPIIYLYPEKDLLVNVELELQGKLTHAYPKYNDGWSVLAKPDGTLYDESGKEYYALYWEGDNSKEFTINEGFVVPGEQTAEFLEKSLDQLGLNRREANEFIVYWLPQLENNPYNLIHFSTTEYEEIAKLNITPRPETLIRVMMVYKPLANPIEIPFQLMGDKKIERKGFTVVEWGGSLYKGSIAL